MKGDVRDVGINSPERERIISGYGRGDIN